MITEKKQRITYPKLFWLFIFGSLFGVVFEGFFCLFKYGAWETHVVSVWGPFCIIYGIGAVLLYVCSVRFESKNILARFLSYAVIASAVEYLCGVILKYGLNMEAWNYSGNFWNIDGIICLKMTLVWGSAGILFSRYAVPSLEKVFAKMEGKGWKIACTCFSVFMAINLTLTGVCIVRWAQRHKEDVADNRVEEYIDEKYNDTYMQTRFMEWRFLDK